MKSSKQRKAEIKRARLEKIRKQGNHFNPLTGPIPDWAIPVNRDEVVHHSMYFDIPLFYIDKVFQCRDCSTQEVWTAKQQKWWYEIAKGSLETTAVLCRACRQKKNKAKQAQKIHMENMAKKKPHPNEIFFKNNKQK